MQARIVGSALVVVVGLIPMAIGGPIFALLMIAIGWAGYREFGHLMIAMGSPPRSGQTTPGYIAIAAIGVAALFEAGTEALFAITAIAVLGSLLLSLPHATSPSALTSWSLVAAGSAYLALPVYAAVSLRTLAGPTSARWVSETADLLSLGWMAAPRGLSWTVLVVFAIWIGDSAAYLAGRAAGRRKLAPRVSPGKTIEGAIGGLLGSMVVGSIAAAGMGLGPWWLGALIGGVVGIAGQIGDLCESFMKRQAGIKDSGALIPGHGGVLDRVDALLFAFPVGWLLAITLGRFGLV